MGCVSEILAEKSRLGPTEPGEQENQGGYPLRLPTGALERSRPVWGWKQLGKLPGGSGSGGLGGGLTALQAGDTARTKENGRSRLGESTDQGLGVAGAAHEDRKSPIFRCCLPALCSNGNTDINQGTLLLVHPLFSACSFSLLPPSLLPACKDLGVS